jgi:hypothetical protein
VSDRTHRRIRRNGDEDRGAEPGQGAVAPAFDRHPPHLLPKNKTLVQAVGGRSRQFVRKHEIGVHRGGGKGPPEHQPLESHII